MSAERDERLYLEDIVTSIDRILDYTSQGRDFFFADRKTQDAVVRNLEIIGEAVKNVSEMTRRNHPEVPWRKVTATRDRVIHGYFNVDLDIVWEVVEHEVRDLRERIAAILQSY